MPNNATADPTIFKQVAEKIISAQQTIIGPMAFEQASQAKGIDVDPKQHSVSISGSPQAAIDALVEQYQQLFGQTAVQASKAAAASLLAKLPNDQLPKSLQ